MLKLFFITVWCVIFASLETSQLYAQNINTNIDNSFGEALAESENHTVEHINRVTYNFNDKMDKVFFQPLASFYNKFFPQLLRQAITNFFSNIDNFSTLNNDILQLNLHNSINDSWRFVINSTVGLLGLIDISSRLGIKAHHEDFGLTLARWGYKNSSYIVLPLFGPSTMRDIIGWPIDCLFFSVYPYIHDTRWRYSLYGISMLDRRSKLLQYQHVVDDLVLDKYIFTRNAYLQHRSAQIKGD